MEDMPGGELARRPLHFLWMVDCSGSMAGEKIAALNHAIKEAIPNMQEVARDNPFAEILVRAITFSTGAKWHLQTPVPIEKFIWLDVPAVRGVTDLGRALIMVADEMRIPPMTERALPPVIVLLSDGQPTDDYGSGLKALMSQPWGVKAVRIAVAIGQDADTDVLQKFMGHPELMPLQANNAETLARYIRWASTAVLRAASSPASQTTMTRASGNIVLPPPPTPMNVTAADVW